MQMPPAALELSIVLRWLQVKEFHFNIQGCNGFADRLMEN